MEKIIVGKIVKAHGLKGEVKVMGITNDINRLIELKEVYIAGHKEEVERIKIANNHALMTLKGKNHINDIEKLIGEFISVSREEAVSLEEGEYFIEDLLNAEVIGDSGKNYGVIKNISNYGGGDVITIKYLGDESYFILSEGMFKNVDIANKKITVDEKLVDEAIV